MLYLPCADKNSKEQFIKKLQLCMKTYDYKDEQKDVKGKVSRIDIPFYSTYGQLPYWLITKQSRQ